MEITIILQIVLLGIALSMDAFAVSVASSLTITDLNKKRIIFIALFFGFMQALMPLIGYFLVEIVSIIVGIEGGSKAGLIMGHVVSWVALVLLLFIGIKMIVEGLKEMKLAPELKKDKKFKIAEIIYFGFATTIDALGSGVALHSGLSNNQTIWLHVSIVLVITFILSLVGLFLGGKISKLFKNKYEITSIIGGIILVILGIWIILSHYFG